MKKIWIKGGAAVICCILLTGMLLSACDDNSGNVVILGSSTSQTTGSSQNVTTGSQPTSANNQPTSQSGIESQSTSSEQTTQNTEPPTTEPSATEPPATEPPTQETTQASTEQPTASTEPKSWDLLNNEPLNPTKSGYDELDRLIEGYFALLRSEGALEDDMSQYQVVHSIYVWFIKRIVYNRGMDADAGKYCSMDPETTPVEVLWAADLLSAYQGCCYNYSSAFMYIMRALGYDAHLLSGQVSSYNGGMTPHCWLYVNLGGEAYTFDPDVDMNYYYRNIDSGEEVTDTLFCRKMNTMDTFYKIETYHTN